MNFAACAYSCINRSSTKLERYYRLQQAFPSAPELYISDLPWDENAKTFTQAMVLHFLTRKRFTPSRERTLSVLLETICADEKGDLAEALQPYLRRMETCADDLMMQPEPVSGEEPPRLIDGMPRRLGRCTLLEKIGEGGNGAVYRAAEDWIEDTTRIVAVKVLHPGSSLRRIERFKSELKIVVHLKSTHIIELYDYGGEDGQLYVVMPLMDGGTLKQRVAGRALGCDEALMWLEQLASALDDAHAAGVVHRDVKPENALLYGDRPHLLLADFGLARSIEFGGTP